MNKETLENIKEKLIPILKIKNLLLWNISFSNKGSILSISLDYNGNRSITLKEISEITPLISEELDKIKPDPFPKKYSLDISSPGVNRNISNKDQLEWSKGRLLKLRFYQKIDGLKNFRGILKSFNDSRLYLYDLSKAQKEKYFLFSNISKISLDEEDNYGKKL